MSREHRFLVDINVGRLAKWLRVLGYDTLLFRGADDGELVRRALREGRTIITRDSHILERRIVTSGRLRAIHISGDDLMGQLRQVIRELGLDTEGHRFSLCLECNCPLVEVEKEAVRSKVPPYVFATQEEFMECTSCHRLYWRGSHWSHMRQEVARLAEEGASPGPP